MKVKIPEEISKNLFAGVWWDKEKVWKLDIPIQEVNIQELDWQLELPIWWSRTGEAGYYDVKPIDVMNEPHNYPIEYQRTLNADLNYPVDVILKQDRYVVLDGLHRVLKAKMFKMSKLNIRIVTPDLAPRIMREGWGLPESLIEV